METIRWVFSGIGVWIMGLFGKGKKEGDVVSQAQSSGDNSTNIQAKGDVNYTNISDD